MYTTNTSRGGSPKLRRLILLVVLLLVVLVGGATWLYLNQNKAKEPVAKYPKYLAFTGSYVFSVPERYVLDDQSLPGIQLLYKGQISVKTLSDAYDANAIALQPVVALANKKGDDFKKGVTDTFVPELKKLSSDIDTTFGSEDGLDTARITVKKDGKAVRLVFIKSGKHPVEIVAKEETPAFTSLEQTVTDVESSELKSEITPLKEAVGALAKLVKDQKGSQLYEDSVPEFKAKTTEADLIAALEKSAPYLQGNFAINGAAYRVNPNEFTAVFTSAATTKDAKPASGVIYLSKADGKWKMKGLNLPSPTQKKS